MSMRSEPPKKLTKRQKLVLGFIIDHIQQWGYPPTIREIGDHLSIRSTNGDNDHLKALERKGYLLRQDSKSRALRPLLDEEGRAYEDDNSSSSNVIEFEDVFEIPIIGQIAAGLPISAIENTQETLHLSQGMLGRAEDVFGLVVQGDSMIEDGIFDGDYIFVRKQPNAERGEIVVVMVDGEATCKRFFDEGDRIRLQPANDAMSPIYLDKSEFRSVDILGKVIGVYRRMH